MHSKGHHNTRNMDHKMKTFVETILQGQNTSGPIYQSTIPEDSELRLYQFNAQEVVTLYPLIFFYATILIVGVLGNALVLLVYSFRYKRSPARVYILFLATIDLCMCSFGLPYHLIDLTHPYTFTNAAVCKTLTFIITMLFHTSIFGLIVIAIDRYLKICKPLGKIQISYLGKKRSCSAAVIISIFMSWPNIVLYGQSEMADPDANITGYSCYFQTEYLENNYPNYPFIYIMTTLSVCIGSTIFLIVAYSMICHQIITRYRTLNMKDLGRSAFDDTTGTDEVSLKNFSSALDVNMIKRGKYCSKSVDELNRVHIYSSNCGIGETCVSDVETLHLYDDSLIVRNSNGSLTFVGDRRQHGPNLNELNNIRNNVDSLQSDETTKPLLLNKSNSAKHIDSSFKQMNQSWSSENIIKDNNHYKLHSNNSVTIHKNNGIIRALDRISKSKADLNRPNSDVCQKCQSSDRLNKQVRMPLLQEIKYTENNLYTRKSGRYSLQVPHDLGNMTKGLSLRRTSDQTGAKSNKWADCQSSDGRYKSSSLGDKSGEGLRIHTSTQSVANSRQGTFKANRTIPKQHSKITKIMLSITIIFILSYSPALIVTIWSIVNPEFWDILNQRETIICEFFLRFYLVNNICNPFIYGFWDKRFKREIIYTFRKIRYELKAKCMCLMCCKVRD